MTDTKPILYDEEYEPESVRERRASSGRSGSIPGLAGSSNAAGDSVYILTTDPGLSWRKYLIGPLIFAYAAGYVTTFAVSIQYVYGRVHDDIFQGQEGKSFSPCNESTNKSDPDFKKQVLVQQTSSDWATYYSIAGGILSIIANVIFGCFTDKFGRRFLLLLPCIGSFLKLVSFCIGVYFKLSLGYFLIGYIIEGMSGQLYAELIGCFTYAADVTPPKGKQRSFAIVVVELSLGISCAIFLFLSGYLIKYTGYFYPNLVSAGMFAIAIIIALCIPESFPKHKRRPDGSALHVLKTAYDLFLGSYNYGRRWMYNLLLISFTLAMFTVFGRSTVETIYVKDNPFCWSAEAIGYFGAARATASQAVGMVLVKLMQKVISDEAIAILGCFSYIASYILEGLAYNDVMMFMVPVLSIFGLLTVPMCRALLSKLTREDQQGAVFATIAGMETTINLVGSIAAAQIYANTVVYYRGIVFFVFASTSLLCLILLSVYRIKTRRTVSRIET